MMQTIHTYNVTDEGASLRYIAEKALYPMAINSTYMGGKLYAQLPDLRKRWDIWERIYKFFFDQGFALVEANFDDPKMSYSANDVCVFIKSTTVVGVNMNKSSDIQDGLRIVLNFFNETDRKDLKSIKEADELHQKFKEAVELTEITRVKSTGSFSIVCRNNQGFYLNRFPVRQQNEEFEMHRFYNDSTIEFIKIIEPKLSESSRNGIALLHGEPGTGKTTFLRYLISRSTKNVVYIPPDLTSAISSPDFITFLLKSVQDSILIVEDAETVLMTREAGVNQSVSNILNISDGILGDALRIKIICTLNTNFNDLDQALRRPGRLLGEHKFEALSTEKANELGLYLYGKENLFKRETTLAKVFSVEEELPMIVDKNKIRMGFFDDSKESSPENPSSSYYDDDD